MDYNDLPPDDFAILVPPRTADNERIYKDTKSRLITYVGWLSNTGRHFDTPDLVEYHLHLLEERHFVPSTIKDHLATVRKRYRTLLNNGTLRTLLERTLPDCLTPEQREEELETILRHIESEILPQATQVKIELHQVEHLRLTDAQITQLLSLPNLHTLPGLRDKAIIALLLCTGIRASELCALEVSDLNQTLGEEKALHVPPGTGCTERLVPYGEMRWVLDLINAWLTAAKISDGPIFRGFYREGNKRRPPQDDEHVVHSLLKKRLAVRTVDKILASYPLEIDGGPVTIHPLDLRRTYARLLYDAGVNPFVIQANLGLKNGTAVLDYIGKEPPSGDRSRAGMPQDWRMTEAQDEVEMGLAEPTDDLPF